MNRVPVDRRTIRRVVALRRSAFTTPTCLLLTISNVTWRQGDYFSGGVDPTVAAKALLAVLGLLLSFDMALTSRRRWPVSATPLLLLGAYLCVTLIGAVHADTLSTSLVLVIRVSITTFTLTLLLIARPLREVAQSLVRSLAAVGLVAAVTGLPTLATGRLSGGFPAIAENELALIFSICALWVARKVVRGAETGLDRVAIAICLGTVFLTGSRTGLLALMLALAVMARYTKRVSLPTLISALFGVPLLLAFGLTSRALTNLVDRGGSENRFTLTNRTIAWDAAFAYHQDLTSHWFGSGLAVKKIPVAGQYWDSQILDSTWVSALVQGGYLAVILLAALVLATLASALRASPVWRPFLLSLTIMLVLRSLLESGLFDVSLGFLFILLISLGAPYTNLTHGEEEKVAISLLKSTKSAPRLTTLDEV